MPRLTREEAREQLILENSVERVINESVRLLDKYAGHHAWTNIEDWEAMKAITVELWNTERDRIFRKRNNLP